MIHAVRKRNVVPLRNPKILKLKGEIQMIIDVKLTEQEEKALKFICSTEVGVKWEELTDHLGVDREEADNIFFNLRKKGFEFNVLATIQLSSSYAHYDSLIKG